MSGGVKGGVRGASVQVVRGGRAAPRPAPRPPRAPAPAPATAPVVATATAPAAAPTAAAAPGAPAAPVTGKSYYQLDIRQALFMTSTWVS